MSTLVILIVMTIIISGNGMQTSLQTLQGKNTNYFLFFFFLNRNCLWSIPCESTLNHTD